MVKILTVCSAGLVRSVALADVLKLHFEPVDVLPAGIAKNTKETLKMLFEWADWIVAMDHAVFDLIPNEYVNKKCLCDVGKDIYGNTHHPELLHKVWTWARTKQEEFGIKETK